MRLPGARRWPRAERAARVGSAALACAIALAACSAGAPIGTLPADSAGDVTVAESPARLLMQEYRPGEVARLHLPDALGPAPLIVLVPGGGWASSDPTGLVPLADRLAEAGASTSLITYSTTDSGSRYPIAVEQVACAVRWSVARATRLGRPPRHTILLGHSAGGHLATLVALSGTHFGRSCPYPPAPIDGLVGLAGIYDTDDFQSLLAEWMGSAPAADRASWRTVNPTYWLTRIPQSHGLRVLLLHGSTDTLVPLAQTTTFAVRLESAGIPVDLSVLPGIGHLDVFDAAVAGPPIEAWLRTWEDGRIG